LRGWLSAPLRSACTREWRWLSGGTVTGRTTGERPLKETPRSIEVGDRPDASISEPTDAVVRVALACVCGSDLWYYRGDSPFEPGPIGHEFVGVVEDVGSDVESIKKGDFVVAPFAFSDGTCPHCRHGVTSACVAGGFFPMNGDGGQGEAVRVPLADGTLVPAPGSGNSDETMRSLLARGPHSRTRRCSRSRAGMASRPLK
jgi:threonine dehydrogenase-like Zn-dependent dehydrogenase